MTARKRHHVMLLGCILALSAAGAWISGQLVKQHAGVWSSKGAVPGLFGRVCEATAGAGFDCTGAIRGPWGMIKFPLPVPSLDSVIGVHTVFVPVAFLGLGYFVFMGVWFAFIGRPRLYGYRWHRVPLGVALCGLVSGLLSSRGRAGAGHRAHPPPGAWGFMGPARWHSSPKARLRPPFARLNFPGNFQSQKPTPPVYFVGTRREFSRIKRRSWSCRLQPLTAGRELSWFIEAMRPVAKVAGPPIPFSSQAAVPIQ